MRSTRIGSAVGLLVVAASIGYCQVRTTQLDAACRKVVVGESESDVIAKMGHPHLVQEGCGYMHSRPVYGCVREYVYFPPFSIVGEAWSISFNERGEAIDTAHFMSP
jgi:hypothetical protein